MIGRCDCGSRISRRRYDFDSLDSIARTKIPYPGNTPAWFRIRNSAGKPLDFAPEQPEIREYRIMNHCVLISLTEILILYGFASWFRRSKCKWRVFRSHPAHESTLRRNSPIVSTWPKRTRKRNRRGCRTFRHGHRFRLSSIPELSIDRFGWPA